MTNSLRPWIHAACQRAGGEASTTELACHWVEACLEAEQSGATLVAATPDEIMHVKNHLPAALWSEPCLDKDLAPDVLFVLYRDCLQLSRMYRSEAKLAQWLKARIGYPHKVSVGADSLTRLCAALDEDGQSPFWRAALTGHGFQLITGGPGSGKTSRVATWLAVHALRLAQEGQSVPLVRLMAPTGKAAMRLQQALHVYAEAASRALEQASEPAYAATAVRILSELMSAPVQTVHRALEFSHRGQPGYHYGRPWAPADLLVLDEASMLNAELAVLMMGAARRTTSILWLGDADQLPPVDAGAVLRDLTTVLTTHSAHMQAVHLRLTQVRRFDPAGPVAALADAVRAGRSSVVAAVPAHREKVKVQLLEMESLQEAVRHWLRERDAWMNAYSALPVEAQIDRSSDWRILTPVHEGPLGAHALNRLVARQWGTLAESGAYAGCPTMVTRNLNGYGLANGDVGVQYSQGRELWVRFAGRDAPVCVPLYALGVHWVPAWASTMHKAQGSEFRDVLVVLPPGLRDEAVSRELLYTAITRVRSLGGENASLTVLATSQSWQQALQVRERRLTGLAQLMDAMVGEAVQ